MAKKKVKSKKKTGRKKLPKNMLMSEINKRHYVVISTYKKEYHGIKIYFEGDKPSFLAKNGNFKIGKAIFDLLVKKYGVNGFKLLITKSDDSFKKNGEIYNINITEKSIKKLQSDSIVRNSTQNTKLVNEFMKKISPTNFMDDVFVYTDGQLSEFLDNVEIGKFSKKDRESLKNKLPEIISTIDQTSTIKIKAKTQIQTLQNIFNTLKNAIDKKEGEGWFQDFIKNNILIIQQGYIEKFDKENVSVGTIKIPDFMLLTHDGYLDILEIKKPDTKILNLDSSRGNYHWAPEISKAISQTENYIFLLEKHNDIIRNYIKDTYGIDIHVVRPRGIILAGNNSNFENQKEKDDFRLLSNSLKHLDFLTYDSLLQRIGSYIQILEKYSK